MIRQASVRILTNFLLLLLVTFTLVFLQFRNRALTFHLGDFSIVLYEITQNKQTSLSHAKLEGRSFELNFGESSTQLKEGVFEKPLSLKDYSSGRDTFTLFFQDNISVSFFLDQDKFLIISAGNLPSEAASLKTPFSLSPRASWRPLPSSPSLAELSYQKQNLELALNTASSWEELKQNRLFLSSEPVKIGPFSQTAVAEVPKPVPVAPPVVERQDPPASLSFESLQDKDLTQAVDIFRDKAYAGLTRRYDRSSSTWARGNSSQFSEKALLATLSEALNRGTYLTQSALMNQAQIRHSDFTTVKTALYLGDIIDQHALTREKKQQEFASLFRDSALSFTVKEDMAQDLFLYATNSEFDRILALLENTNPLEQDWDLISQANFFLNYAQTRDLTTRPVANSFLNLAEDLINQYSVVEKDLFLLKENGQWNPEASLKLASAVFKMTDGSVSFARLRSMARTLMIHTLGLANDQGAFVQEEGTLYPEEVYAYVSFSPFLPKVFLLSSVDRSWAFFASDVVSSSLSQEDYSFQLSFFTEVPEYAIFSNIPFPQLVYFRGITWRTDPQFQIYTDGWSYLTRTQSLYLKISHLLGSNVDLRVSVNPDLAPEL